MNPIDSLLTDAVANGIPNQRIADCRALLAGEPLLRRAITFRPAFDRRSPDPSKNYGIHGVDMTWLLIGPELIVQFVVYTNWHLPHVQEELDNRETLDSRFPHLHCRPDGADLGYHSVRPWYEGMEPRSDCHLLDNRPCYYDGSGLNAQALLQTLIEHGGEAVWDEMLSRHINMTQQIANFNQDQP